MSGEVVSLKPPVIPDKFEIESSWLEQRNILIVQAMEIVAITSKEEFEAAEILLKKVTVTENDAEKMRKKLSKPFSDFASEIKRMGDEAKKPLLEIKDKLKKLIVDYRLLKDKEKQAELERLAEESASPFDEFIDQEQAPVKLETSIGDVKSLCSTIKKVWKFEIEIPVEVPREFCSPDDKKIREYVQREKDGAAIPGVRIWEETVAQSR